MQQFSLIIAEMQKNTRAHNDFYAPNILSVCLFFPSLNGRYCWKWKILDITNWSASFLKTLLLVLIRWHFFFFLMLQVFCCTASFTELMEVGSWQTCTLQPNRQVQMLQVKITAGCHVQHWSWCHRGFQAIHLGAIGVCSSSFKIVACFSSCDIDWEIKFPTKYMHFNEIWICKGKTFQFRSHFCPYHNITFMTVVMYLYNEHKSRTKMFITYLLQSNTMDESLRRSEVKMAVRVYH